MATATPHRRMTLAEFLAWDDGTETHYELVRGHVVVLAPPTEHHGAILANPGRHLANHLTPPCRAVARAGIMPPDREDTSYEADLAVTRAPPEPGRQHVVDPILIVEILSPSTARRDQDTKLPDHRTIPSVREILVVSSRGRRVEHWRRGGGAGEWTVRDLIGKAELRLETIDAAIPLAAVYENVAV